MVQLSFLLPSPDFSLFQSATSDIMMRSILGQLLPEAMVCFLENYGDQCVHVSQCTTCVVYATHRFMSWASSVQFNSVDIGWCCVANSATT